MILQKGSPVLREKAKEVSSEEIRTPKIQKIIKEMKDALHREPDGVALAAPQIGYGVRIFMTCEPCFEDYSEIEDVEERKKKLEEKRSAPHKDQVFINPEIIKLSKKREDMNEGCLSVRWKYGEVKRALQARVRAYDEDGKVFERGASGLLAQAFQHEIDHLDGILFIDKASNLEEINPQDLKDE